MVGYLFDCFLYILPVLMAGLLFIFTIKAGLFGFLGIPVSESLFGKNKTFRGFVLMPFYCLVSVWFLAGFLNGGNGIYAAENLYKSLILGFAYPLGELPNSFFKRKLGIAPGKAASENGQKMFFMVLDNIDSVIMCCICLALVCRVDLVYLPGVLALGSVFHASTDILMTRLKLKLPR